MTDMLVRPLADNRMLRAAGGADLTTTLGQSLGAVFEAPMMTGLLGQTADLQVERFNAPTAESIARVNIEEFNRNQEILSLQSEMETTVDSVRQDEITTQLNALTAKEKNILSPVGRESLDSTVFQTPESLNELYGELDLKFDRPMTAGEAKILADNKRAEMIRHAIISKSPSGLLPTVAKFGAGLAAMAVDPLEVASMFIPVVGIAGRAAAVARFGKVGGRVLVGATEGFAGSALTEPFYYGLSRQQQLDYTMSDALLNVGLGTVFGGGIGAIGGVLARADVPVAKRVDGESVRVDMPEAARAVPEPTRIDNATAKIARADADIAVRQFVNDQSVDVGPSRIQADVPQKDGSPISFEEWNTDNKAVIETGEPIQLYHGAGAVFEEFDVTRGAERFDGSAGIFLTSRRGLAVEHAMRGETPTVIKAEASVRKPVEVSSGSDSPDTYWLRNSAQLEADVKRGDRDGIIIRGDDGEVMVIAIDPDQVRITGDGSKGPAAKANDAPELAQKAQVDPRADTAAAKAYDDFVGEDFASEAFIKEDIAMLEGMVEQISDVKKPVEVVPDYVAVTPDQSAKILGDDRWLSRGVKLRKNATLWRGTNETSGDHAARLGEGLYFTADKRTAAEFAGETGDIIEMGRENLPENALRFETNNDLEMWLQTAHDALGMKKREFNAKYKDVAEFVHELDPTIDGIQLFTGKESEFVLFGTRDTRADVPRIDQQPKADKYAGLTPEQRVMMDEVTEMETRAKSYADISRVAATCMART